MTLPIRAAAPRPPTRPSAPARPSFPWVAALAPVLSAVVLYAVTRSPMMLAFAALGPVVVIASSLDAGRVRRRTVRREAERYDQELRAYDAAQTARAREELEAMRTAAPDARAILRGGLPADARWRRRAREFEPVLGRGTVVVAAGGDVRSIADAPLRVPFSVGIGVVGPPVVARAFARGLLLQALELVAPDELGIVLPPGREWDCLRSAPHVRGETAGVRWRVCEIGADAKPGGGTDLLVLAGSASELPPSCRCVVELGGRGPDRVVGREGAGRAEELTVAYVSAGEALRFAEALARSAGSAGERAMPESVSLSELGALERVGGEKGLPVVLGIGPAGPVEIDLVADGPHAIVGGTTGSGKSELLVAWVLALAARHGPAGVTFLLADFKGGAGFAPLAALPHVTGVITDLDQHGADRAFASVAAELRRRERLLAERGVPDIARLPVGALARLIVVVDECAVVLERSPDLHRAFADIAARGRSLGVHLILCTQRPVGVVRDAVAANCGLRIALRVHDPADSRSLVGSDAAARIPHRAPGRCIVAHGGRSTLMQAALPRTDDAARAALPADREVPVHRPWLDPLPSRLPAPAPQAGRLLLGVVDRPGEQRQDVVELTRSSLLVLGAAGSGRSTALRQLAAQIPGRAVLGPDDLEEVWDSVTGGEGPVVIDDLDLLLRRCADEGRRRLLDALQTAVRSGRRRIVLSARRTTDGIAALREGVDDVLLLRTASRQEHQLLAGDGEPYRPELPPGGGWWRGERIQVFAPSTPPAARLRRRPEAVRLDAVPMVVVTNASGAVRKRMEAWCAISSVPEALALDGALPEGMVVGTAADWAPARALLARARRTGLVVLDVPPAEARILLGPLPDPPLCAPGSLLVEQHGEVRRARWPDGAPGTGPTGGIRGEEGSEARNS
ncbi:FtsK/SpoIIIE domain-containing protein [Rathayibacter sp. ZW T2_19]|uniref:FtsK/SpoIIIE domain-containing protein n=1 Tax=Rathayibacter rubneri TaxID=2950106 RepID=A0A9X2IR56_9MICO|nr:FtsK/SpoIIIE domain-containing protein [Rathayibacter rubneri]MCM6761111.1 FtsK/SpoIIIE domain-containing protein [Rathayibacter rubneri]